MARCEAERLALDHVHSVEQQHVQGLYDRAQRNLDRFEACKCHNCWKEFSRSAKTFRDEKERLLNPTMYDHEEEIIRKWKPPDVEDDFDDDLPITPPVYGL